jgi:argininosuccinate lyase
MSRDVVRQGRLEAGRSDEISSFLSSMDADRRIAKYDLLVDLAHVVMLNRMNILDDGSAGSLSHLLLDMHDQGITDEAFDDIFEDIHAGIESYLIRTLGPEAGGRLHAGRSRNDEVSTCIRLCTRDDLLAISRLLQNLRRTLISIAEANTETVMPGFTHFQHAQPTTLAHHLLAYEEMFGRDQERIRDAYARINRSPLGAAAFASTTYPIDRELTAQLLGFDGVAQNTMDAVASRDGPLEVLSILSILMVNVSRLCEELVVWSSPFVNFVTLPDACCSTSSIMPQKRNPDTAEIMRAKSGVLIGALNAALVIMKGLPLSYNRDLQELTPHLWKGTETVVTCLKLLGDMVRAAEFNRERMASEAGRNFSTATDLADLLVREIGLPFRTAHNIVGRAVSRGSVDLAVLDEASRELSGETLTSRGLTQAQVDASFNVWESVERRDRPGGPASRAVRQAIEKRKKVLKADEEWVHKRRTASMEATRRLMEEAAGIAS